VTGFKLPLALSLAAHAILVALLFLLPTPAAPVQPPLATTGGIEVAFAPSLPQPEKPPVPPLPVKAEPPPAPPPAPPIEPPPPAPEATVIVPEPSPPPPPPSKPAVPMLSKPALRHPERERPPTTFAAPVPPAASAPQTAYAPMPAPAPAPSTEISLSYRALLSEWLESHKRYPDNARQQGEEGRAVLRFVVERSGRVADFAVVESTGHPDLDAALENMMRGATLPPFPAGMDESRIEVSVAIRFSLGR
jgi:periplasmic protein TonB